MILALFLNFTDISPRKIIVSRTNLDMDNEENDTYQLNQFSWPLIVYFLERQMYYFNKNESDALLFLCVAFYRLHFRISPKAKLKIIA